MPTKVYMVVVCKEVFTRNYVYTYTNNGKGVNSYEEFSTNN